MRCSTTGISPPGSRPRATGSWSASRRRSPSSASRACRRSSATSSTSRFADANPELIAAFADASRAAKELLKGDAEWERIRPLTKAEDDATFEALKRRYREGIIERWGEAEQADAAELYAILAELGGEKLVGGGDRAGARHLLAERDLLRRPWRAPAKPAPSSGRPRRARRSRRRSAWRRGCGRRCCRRPRSRPCCSLWQLAALYRRQPAPPAVAGAPCWTR